MSMRETERQTALYRKLDLQQEPACERNKWVNYEKLEWSLRIYLFGGSSGGAKLLLYPSLKTINFSIWGSFEWDPHRVLKEEEDIWLAIQASWINPISQRVDRCHSQITLTFKVVRARDGTWLQENSVFQTQQDQYTYKLRKCGNMHSSKQDKIPALRRGVRHIVPPLTSGRNLKRVINEQNTLYWGEKLN